MRMRKAIALFVVPQLLYQQRKWALNSFRQEIKKILAIYPARVYNASVKILLTILSQ